MRWADAEKPAERNKLPRNLRRNQSFPMNNQIASIRNSSGVQKKPRNVSTVRSIGLFISFYTQYSFRPLVVCVYSARTPRVSSHLARIYRGRLFVWPAWIACKMSVESVCWCCYVRAAMRENKRISLGHWASPMKREIAGFTRDLQRRAANNTSSSNLMKSMKWNCL